jgi:hypothetical protein
VSAEVNGGEPEAVVAEPEAVVAEPEAVVAEPEAVVAEPEAVVAEPEVVVAESEAVVAEPEVVVAGPEAAPDDTLVWPRPVSAGRQPEPSEPEREPQEPEPEGPELEAAPDLEPGPRLEEPGLPPQPEAEADADADAEADAEATDEFDGLTWFERARRHQAATWDQRDDEDDDGYGADELDPPSAAEPASIEEPEAPPERPRRDRARRFRPTTAPARPETEPETTEPEPEPLSLGERSRIRRRARYLRRLREVQLRDLGGFVLELSRFGRERPDLVAAKVRAAALTDRELRSLEQTLDGQVSLREIREAGIGGACPECGAVHGSADNFCATCGAHLGDHPDDDPDLLDDDR